MRVSNPGQAARMLNEITGSQQRLAEVQERVSSGRRISRPSDDPFGASRVMAARTRMEHADQYRRNIDIAHIDLSVTESALNNVNSLLQRGLELSVQAGNSTLDGSSRSQIAYEVDRLLEEAISLSNTTHAGRQIFAGYRTGTTPFVPDIPGAPTAIPYGGDSGVIEREVGAGERITVSVPGDQVFPAVFSALMSLRDNLRTDDVAALQADASALHAQVDRVLQFRGDIGAKVRRLDMARDRLEEDTLQLRQMIGALEDADFAESIAQLQMRDTALQAALAAAAKSLGTSLLEFLR